MSTDIHHSRITASALQFGLEPTLVEALVQVESGGNQWAWNPEPVYRYLWDVKKNAPFRKLLPGEARSKFPPSDFPTLAGDRDQEWWAQQASWGLMQIMGAVARELGFRGRYLTELVDPQTNLNLGCLKLQQLYRRAGDDTERVLAMYNGGPYRNVVRPFRNAAYAAKVLRAQELLT